MISGKYPIAIDIDDGNIYALQLKKTRKGFIIRGYWHREMEAEVDGHPEKVQSLLTSLKEMTRSGQFSGKKAILHLPTQSLTVFPVRFQVGRTDSLEGAMLRESAKHLSFPIEEAIIDYLSIIQEPAAVGNAYKATIIAVRRDHLQRYLSVTKQAGLKVEVFDSTVSSMLRLHRRLYGIPDNPVILCNLGSTKSVLVIVNRDSILSQRDISWGVNVIYEGILANFELSNDRDQAIIMLKRYGLAYEDRGNPAECGGPAGDAMDDQALVNISRSIFQIITPYLEELVYEFHKMIGYVRSEERNPAFEGIYMYGQAVLIHCLDRYLGRRLNIPTKLINPLNEYSLSSKITLPEASEGAPLALTLGLAMRRVPWL